MVELLTRKIVDRIILIPAGEPRLRSEQPIVDGASRLEMCKLAINDLPIELRDRVTASDIEIKRSGSTYAIDTVEELEKLGDDLYWIIGSDAYAKIDQWHRSGDLKEKVSFIVIERPGSELEDGIDIGALDISATEIRSDINKKREPEGVSPSVRKYISERKLYAGK